MAHIKDPVKKYSHQTERGESWSAELIATGTGTPTSGVLGDIAFDRATGKLWVHDGSNFIDVGSLFIRTGTGSPTSGDTGEKYFDLANNKLWIHNGTAYVSVTLS